MLIKKVTKNYTESDHRATQKYRYKLNLGMKYIKKLRVIDYSK